MKSVLLTALVVAFLAVSLRSLERPEPPAPAPQARYVVLSNTAERPDQDGVIADASGRAVLFTRKRAEDTAAHWRALGRRCTVVLVTVDGVDAN